MLIDGKKGHGSFRNILYRFGLVLNMKAHIAWNSTQDIIPKDIIGDLIPKIK